MKKKGNIKVAATYLVIADSKLKNADKLSAIRYYYHAFCEIENCSEEERQTLKTEIGEARGNLYDLEQEEQRLGISFNAISVPKLRESFENINS